MIKTSSSDGQRDADIDTPRVLQMVSLGVPRAPGGRVLSTRPDSVYNPVVTPSVWDRVGRCGWMGPGSGGIRFGAVGSWVGRGSRDHTHSTPNRESNDRLICYGVRSES